ncbi:MAG: GAF domain-containing protein, partial [Dehalococcoidia bacterium]|nr:GAF domain-containing protein [Dehalococcoidia bacterium]
MEKSRLDMYHAMNTILTRIQRRLETRPAMRLSPLRWATMVVPAAVLIVFDYLRHFVLPYSFLHGWAGFILLWILVLAGVMVFSQTVFMIIGWMEREVLHHNRELAMTAETATALGQTLELEQMLNVTLEKVLEVTGVEAGTVCVLDEAKRELVHLAYRGLPPEVIGPLHRAKLSQDPIGAEVVDTGKPVILSDLWLDPRVAEVAQKAGFRSCVSVPLKAEGKVMGVIALASRHERTFAPSEVSMLLSIGSQLGMAMQNAVLFEDLVRRNKEM